MGILVNNLLKTEYSVVGGGGDVFTFNMKVEPSN